MLRSVDEKENGVRDFILNHREQGNQRELPCLVVILAGTNDLAYTGKVKPVVECISALHRVCWDCGVAKTVAVGIPPSEADQANHLDAADLCCEANDALKEFCRLNPRATYVPFPELDDKKLVGQDGHHLTQAGYHQLGLELAPAIDRILKSK